MEEIIRELQSIVLDIEDEILSKRIQDVIKKLVLIEGSNIE